MLLLYNQLYAECHKGFINAPSKATGRLAWQKHISDKSPGKIDVHSLLSTGDFVISEGIEQIISFDKKGQQLWQRPKWYGTPVVLRDGWIYYTSASRKDRMEAIDMNNQMQIEDFRIPFAEEDGNIVLFEPMQKGLIAQVQFMSMGEGIVPNFIVYKIHEGGIGFDWSRSYSNERSYLMPLINYEKHFLVTTTQKEVLVFDTNTREREPEPIERFPLPLGAETIWSSCGSDGSLYWTGMDKNKTALVLTDFKGNKKWGWQAGISLGLEKNRPIAPPIVTPDRVLILTKKNLFAIKDGRLLWSFGARESNFSSATALSDETVLIAEGNKLHRIDSRGNSLFMVVVEKTIVTPPVIDGEGNIYVAGSDTIYAIH